MALEALKTIPLSGNIRADSRPSTMITATYGVELTFLSKTEYYDYYDHISIRYQNHNYQHQYPHYSIKIFLEPFAFAIIIPHVHQFPSVLGYIPLLVYPKSLVR